MLDERIRVFYVDDNPKQSRMLTSLLEECGFRVIAVNDPAAALSFCKQTTFDIALLDYDMPGITGSQLAEEIKFVLPDIPIVLISGYTALPATELVFVDAHFGFGTALDDLLWTMRILAKPLLPGAITGRLVARHADST
jgi:CheY-like chemotaxis protein